MICEGEMLRSSVRRALLSLDRTILRELGQFAAGYHVGAVDHTVRTPSAVTDAVSDLKRLSLLNDMRRFYRPRQPRDLFHGLRRFPLHAYRLVRNLVKGPLKRI